MQPDLGDKPFLIDQLLKKHYLVNVHLGLLGYKFVLILVLFIRKICWFHGSSFKGFSIVFLLPDWLKLNHLKSWMERGFSDIFSRHICSTVAETMGVTNNPASFGAKKCSENHIWSCWDDSWSMEPTKTRVKNFGFIRERSKLSTQKLPGKGYTFSIKRLI